MTLHQIRKGVTEPTVVTAGVENVPFFCAKMTRILTSPESSDIDQVQALNHIIDLFMDKVQLVSCVKQGLGTVLLQVCKSDAPEQHMLALRALAKVAAVPTSRDFAAYLLPALIRQVLVDMSHEDEGVAATATDVTLGITDLTAAHQLAYDLVYTHNLLPAVTRALSLAQLHHGEATVRGLLLTMRAVVRSERACTALVEHDMATDHAVLAELSKALRGGAAGDALGILARVCSISLGRSQLALVPGLLEGLCEAGRSPIAREHRWAIKTIALAVTNETAARALVELGVVDVAVNLVGHNLTDVRTAALETLVDLQPVRSPRMLADLQAARDRLEARVVEVNRVKLKGMGAERARLDTVLEFIRRQCCPGR